MPECTRGVIDPLYHSRHNDRDSLVRVRPWNKMSIGRLMKWTHQTVISSLTYCSNSWCILSFITSKHSPPTCSFFPNDSHISSRVWGCCPSLQTPQTRNTPSPVASQFCHSTFVQNLYQKMFLLQHIPKHWTGKGREKNKGVQGWERRDAPPYYFLSLHPLHMNRG